jgi:hypothetical protein
MDLENILATQFQRAEQSLAEHDRRAVDVPRILMWVIFGTLGAIAFVVIFAVIVGIFAEWVRK